jgi:hypothetical protein
MASIITATTTSGLTQSADNSGVLQLASGTGNLVTVPSVTGTAMVSGNMPAFSVYKSSAQSVSATTWTKITFDVEEFDTNNNFASSTFTPTVAGYYQINGQVSNGANTQTSSSIYKNGSIYKAGANYSSGFASVVSSIIYLNGSTDYVEFYAYFGTTSNTGDGVVSTWFNGVLVRGA